MNSPPHGVIRAGYLIFLNLYFYSLVSFLLPHLLTSICNPALWVGHPQVRPSKGRRLPTSEREKAGRRKAMGQYYVAANITMREFLYPYRLGSGGKLIEMFYSDWYPKALLAALALGNWTLPDHPFVGRWAGDQVIVVIE